jgi:ribosome biogenesis protein MAK21
MKLAIATEIEQLLFRKNLGPRAQYYCVIALSQLLFRRNEAALAQKCISVYFSLFKQAASVNDDNVLVNSKLLSALLTGVNRAFPYAAQSMTADAMAAFYDQQTDALFMLIHKATFNIGVQALMLLFQVLSQHSSISDRYHRAMYQMLRSGELLTTSKLAYFLNVLYKSVKADSSEERVCAFVKRLLQTALHHRPTFVCGALVLVSELMKHHTFVKFLITESAATEGDDEEHFVDAVNDSDMDVDSSDSDSDSDSESKQQQRQRRSKQSSSSKKKLTRGSTEYGYDPLKRDPLFARARHSCVTELNQLAVHFHPSVATFAQTLLRGDPITYSGDPLVDFTNGAFLDRFVYRNPKKQSELATLKSKRRLHSSESSIGRKEHKRAVLVHSEKFLRMSEDAVLKDDLFFHRYFQGRRALKMAQNGGVPLEDSRKKKKDKREQTPEDEEAEMDAYANHIIEQQMRSYGNADIDDPLDFNMDDYNALGDPSSDDDDAVFDTVPMRETKGPVMDSSEDESDDAGYGFEEDGDEDSPGGGDGDDDDDEVDAFSNTGGGAPKGNGDDDMDSVFASSEAFAQLLEGAETTSVHPMEMKHRQKMLKRRGNSSGEPTPRGQRTSLSKAGERREQRKRKKPSSAPAPVVQSNVPHPKSKGAVASSTTLTKDPASSSSSSQTKKKKRRRGGRGRGSRKKKD